MSKKKSEHYVNNKELLEALVVYREKVEKDFKVVAKNKKVKREKVKGRN